MTEHEWLTAEPVRLAEFVAARLGARRARLLAVALCRSVAARFDDPILDPVIEVAERFADGDATRDELETARQAARETAVKAHAAYDADAEPDPATAARHETRRDFAWATAFCASSPVPVGQVCFQVELAGVKRPGTSSLETRREIEDMTRTMRALVWDVAGNPFRPVEFAPWRTATAVALARQMYDAREFSAMPILADALQDAGCHDDAVLAHCRATGTHVRGCWVLDGVLGLA